MRGMNGYEKGIRNSKVWTGEEMLLDCLERNERNGVIYHRQGITGDYDDFEDIEMLMEFIKTGRR